MPEPKTQLIFPPIKIGKQKFSIGRALRFLVGLVVIVHTACLWDGDLAHTIIRYVIGIALVDIRLLPDIVAAWKSRSGR